MKAIEIKKGVYWVGGIDWDLRNFHGYATPRGSSYNAYLIAGEKTVLVDTVKHYLFPEMLERIKSVTDPSGIDYVVSNHVEMDHSGSLPHILEHAKNAVIVTSPNGEKGLKKHFLASREWKFKVVNTGEDVNIGQRNMKFVLMPMVHWPDSMATYVPEEKLLLPNDGFGQHVASTERFDDELGGGIAMEELAKYYANIVLPYGAQVNKVLDAVGGLDIDMIAPSHGIIWRTYHGDAVKLYRRWANNECTDKAGILYDTMWGSTAKIALAIAGALEEKNISAKLINLGITEISDAMTAVLEAKYIFVGSPTLNSNMMPSVAAFLTYMKGLAPKNRVGMAFGSYGWGGQSVGQVEDVLKGCGFEMLEQAKVQYVPGDGDLEEVRKKIKECG